MAGPSLPTLPVDVDPLVRQVDGDSNTRDIYQTHRGKPSGRETGQPPQSIVPDGPVRYAQD